MRALDASLTRVADWFLVIALAIPRAAMAQAEPEPSTDPVPLFGQQDLYMAAGVLVGTFALIPLDKELAQLIRSERPQSLRILNEAAEGFHRLGFPGTVIIGGALYGIGRAVGNERMADLGLHGTEAVIVGLTLVGIVKPLAGRARPYVSYEREEGFQPLDFGFGRGWGEEQYRSFPSGHAVAATAAAAAVVTEVNEWWPNATFYIAPVMFAGAALIGVSRMYDNYHWASDVLLGSAIGAFAGWKVVRWNHDHPDNDINDLLLGVSLRPHPDGRGYGVHLFARRR